MIKLNKTIIISLVIGLFVGLASGVLIGREIYTKRYTITFNTDGGNTLKSIKVKENAKVPKPKDPIKDGYEFVTWLSENETFDFQAKVNKDISLTAKWEEVEAKLTLNTDNLTLMVGETVTLEANIKDNLTWQSNDSQIVKIDAKGQIKALAVGKATITVKTKSGQKQTCQVNVVAKDEKIVLVEKLTITGKKEVMVASTIKLTASISPKDATNKNLKWQSSNSKIATVDQNGKVKGIKTGSVTITVTSENGKKATYKIEVKAKNDTTKPNETAKPSENPTTTKPPQDKTVAVNGIKIKGGTEVNVKGTLTLMVSIDPTNATDKKVTWSSSNEGIATVDANGRVTGASEGTVTITAKTSNGKTAKHQVEVKSVYVITLTANYLLGNLSDYSFEVKKDGDPFKGYTSFVIGGNSFNKDSGVVGKDDVADMGGSRTTTIIVNGQTKRATVVIN